MKKAQRADIEKKFRELERRTRLNFRKKGIVIPASADKGGVRLENYSVVKEATGFYSVVTAGGRVVYSGINLSMTAALVANRMAIAGWVDQALLDLDLEWGYYQFEDEYFGIMCEKFKKKNDWIRHDSTLIKREIAHNRAEEYKKKIVVAFDHLRRLR